MQLKKYDIFISYRQLYIPWVELLYLNLTERGYNVFLDTKSLTSGQPLDIIFSHIKQASHFIIIVTNDIEDPSFPWVLEEYQCAKKLQRNDQIKIHPIIFCDSIPKLFQDQLCNHNFSENSKISYRNNFKKLCDNLENIPNSFEPFTDWLDIPENGIYASKLSNPKKPPLFLEEKAKLASQISKLKRLNDIDSLNIDDAKKIHNIFCTLYKSKNNEIKRQSLLILCLIQHNYTPFIYKKIKLKGLSISKINNLIKRENITKRDKDRLKNLPFRKKSLCKLVIR